MGSGALGGVRADEYTLHPLRIRGASHLSAAGASPETLQREGLWASYAFKPNVRSHGKDASYVAKVMAQVGRANGIKPEQGTNWGQVNSTPKLEGWEST